MNNIISLTDYKGNSAVFIKNTSRVALHSRRYFPNDHNPVIGTNHACNGTVLNIISHSDRPIEVLWDNGCVNRYKGTDLAKVRETPDTEIVDFAENYDGKGLESTNPNTAFRLKRK